MRFQPCFPRLAHRGAGVIGINIGLLIFHPVVDRGQSGAVGDERQHNSALAGIEVGFGCVTLVVVFDKLGEGVRLLFIHGRLCIRAVGFPNKESFSRTRKVFAGRQG